jgi:hypothetical protein
VCVSLCLSEGVVWATKSPRLWWFSTFDGYLCGFSSLLGRARLARPARLAILTCPDSIAARPLLTYLFSVQGAIVELHVAPANLTECFDYLEMTVDVSVLLALQVPATKPPMSVRQE